MSIKGIKDNKCLEEMDFTALREELKREILELSFPIGKEYVTQEDINPATILGFGTWERVKGRVLVGLNEDSSYFNEIGKEGGETTHTLTLNEIPTHSHTYSKTNLVMATDFDRSFTASGVINYSQSTINTSTSGGGQAHNNVQPYKVVGYMWIRTA